MATYYVAPHGDDANAGTAPGAPFRTINKAAQVMADGDVCYVAPGVYRESVTIPSPGSGTKFLTFIGDRDARKFTSVTPGEVRLDGSDDDVTPVRNTGVTVNQNAGIKWCKINVTRFVSYGFDLRSYQTRDHVLEDLIIDGCQSGIYLSQYVGIVMRRVNVFNATHVVYAGTANGQNTVSAEDCFFSNVEYGFYMSNSVASRLILSRIFHLGIGSGATIDGNGRIYAEDVAVANASLLNALGYSSSDSIFRRVTVVNTSGYAVVVPASTGSVESVAVWDSLFAECTGGIRLSSINGIGVANRCAFLDVATPALNIRHEKDRWETTTDGQGNVILPDFTPVGAQLLRAEEENPIEGLRSARIDVPRVAYYPFKVAVAGGNTITLKARKSHPTGTTVKFRVDKDPNKVVTLADTDEVQTIQLGPVEDRGPRFVELEFWAQQVDYIPGHYVLIDSIQVV